MTLFDEQEAVEYEAEIEHRRRTWSIAICQPGNATGAGCSPTIETRYEPHGYRGVCFGCDWRGESVEDENEAVEDAHDHAWPGWRELPIVESRMPNQEGGKRGALKMEKWADALIEQLTPYYPADWLADGGAPIRTVRTGIGTRHVPGWSPWGGYDLTGAVLEDDE